MKIKGNKSKGGMAAAKPASNQSKKDMYVIIVAVITVLLIVWVFVMGRKAEQTVTVAMFTEDIYKNEVITESMFQPYDMVKAEFEKYAVTKDNGTTKRRILLWEEKDMILGAFAAYPLREGTVAMYTDFIKARTDNSDSVLYSFPGKNIVAFDMGDSDLKAFKTFLQPGDKVNIKATYSESETVEVDEYGTTERVEVYREETVFQDIMIADILNSHGDSILDIYASYKDKTVYQQAQLDASESFQASVEPSSLLVALTPEEETRYYYYLNKDNAEFSMSLPQRMD